MNPLRWVYQGTVINLARLIMWWARRRYQILEDARRLRDGVR